MFKKMETFKSVDSKVDVYKKNQLEDFMRH